jgi:hypothetical protein
MTEIKYQKSCSEKERENIALNSPDNSPPRYVSGIMDAFFLSDGYETLHNSSASFGFLFKLKKMQFRSNG